MIRRRRLEPKGDGWKNCVPEAGVVNRFDGVFCTANGANPTLPLEAPVPNLMPVPKIAKHSDEPAGMGPIVLSPDDMEVDVRMDETTPSSGIPRPPLNRNTMLTTDVITWGASQCFLVAVASNMLSLALLQKNNTTNSSEQTCRRLAMYASRFYTRSHCGVL